MIIAAVLQLIIIEYTIYIKVSLFIRKLMFLCIENSTKINPSQGNTSITKYNNVTTEHNKRLCG